MHFFYLDETGCSGDDLSDKQEPIFVLGGVSVKDKGWVTTTKNFTERLHDYFGISALPNDFELHAHQLLSPEGSGPFLGDDRHDRNELAYDLLRLLASRQHQVHYIAIKKSDLATYATGSESPAFDARVPYLLSYNYLVTYIEYFTKNYLGHTARGMTILDIKDQYESQIETITHYRRYEVPAGRRLKWIVEFTYPVDSKRHPMVQLSDLVIFFVRKFFEMDCGLRPGWGPDAREFFASGFDLIYDRVRRKSRVIQEGPEGRPINSVIDNCYLTPSHNWRSKYGI